MIGSCTLSTPEPPERDEEEEDDEEDIEKNATAGKE